MTAEARRPQTLQVMRHGERGHPRPLPVVPPSAAADAVALHVGGGGRQQPARGRPWSAAGALGRTGCRRTALCLLCWRRGREERGQQPLAEVVLPLLLDAQGGAQTALRALQPHVPTAKGQQMALLLVAGRRHRVVVAIVVIWPPPREWRGRDDLLLH